MRFYSAIFSAGISLVLAVSCGGSYALRDTMSPATEAARMDRMSDTEGGDRDEADNKPTRLVIYTADLRISVISHESAVEAASGIAQNAGGFVESSESQPSAAESRITIRVPSARFQDTIRLLAKLGTVIDRNVKAADVTKEFLDTENRIALSRIARDRLYTLLRRVTDLKERVKILKEIDRLTGEIDALTARSTYLKSRGDFSTITTTFTSGSNKVALKRPSVFKWVRDMNHAGRSLFEAQGLSVDRPPGFFDYSSTFYPKLFGFIAGSGESVYQAPDGTLIRAGSARNYPKGTPQFWESVLRKELERKGYRVLESKQDGRGWLLRTQLTENLNTQYYNLYIIVNENWIHVSEAVFPDANALAHEAAVNTALKSMKGGQ